MEPENKSVVKLESAPETSKEEKRDLHGSSSGGAGGGGGFGGVRGRGVRSVSRIDTFI